MKISEYIMVLLVGVSPINACSQKKSSPESTDAPLSLNISQEAIDMIIYYEVGGKRFIKSHIWYATQTGINKLENYKKKIRGD